jgi:hypothetical protein
MQLLWFHELFVTPGGNSDLANISPFAVERTRRHRLLRRVNGDIQGAVRFSSCSLMTGGDLSTMAQWTAQQLR